MKKLLGILGTITIAGSGMAGLVGNAPAPAKKEVNYLQTNNLETLKRIKRELFNNVLFLNSSSLESKEIDEIQNITVIKVLKKNTLLSSVKAGSVYFGTTNGVYFIYKNSWEPRKINGVTGIIKKIEIDPTGNVYILNEQGKVFYLGYDQTNVRIMDEIKYPVNDFIIFEKDTPNPNIKAGSVYFGTTNGVYFRYHNSQNSVAKINLITECNCDSPENNIKKLFLDLDGNLYFKVLCGTVYYVSLNSWTPERVNKINNLNSIAVFEKDTPNSSVKKGDIYFGTTNGIYFKSKNSSNDTIRKVDEKDNNFIKLIEILPNGDAYSLDSNGNVYYVPFDSWEVTKVNEINNVNIIASVKQDTFINSVKKNSVYFGKNDGIYLKVNISSDIQKINEINNSVKLIELSPNGSAFILGS